MNRVYKTLLFFWILLICHSNKVFGNSRDTTIAREFKLNAELVFGSNNMSNALAYKFLFGGALTENEIDKSINPVREINRLGFISGHKWSYTMNKFSSKKGSYKIGYAIQNKMFIGVKYGKDAAGFILKGNAAYKNQTAIIDPFKINYLSYNSIEFNYSKSNWDYAIGIGMATGFKKLSLEQGEIYTSLYGDSIYGNLEGYYLNSGKKAYNTQNPLAYISLSKTWQNKIGRVIKLTINNLGLVYVNEAKKYEKNGTFQISQVNLYRANLNNSQSYNESIDSVINQIIPVFTNTSTLQLLPFDLVAQWSKLTADKSKEKYGAFIKYLPLPGFLPQLGLNYLLFDKTKKNYNWYTYGLVTLGGFDTYDLVINTTVDRKKMDYFISLGSIEGIILPISNHGIQLQLGIKWNP